MRLGGVSQIDVGSEVTLRDGEDRTLTVRLVPPDDTAFDDNPVRISVHSPLGSALIGQRVGDTVTVQGPSSVIVYRIIDVRAPTFNDEAAP